ncbi:energy-coupling factor transporter transmembrane protein EcfT [Arthrobacter sp. H5]|uniref:energy-coupling factor transporter transmembrane component T family protein n=1 Tax=Arthrobacter sp. H5 TaxID=1267973 RepID=UPI0006885528|nr:energy-coupling factor transporter transmembrane protein EcfT [Arthrobacter sp. H5]
MRGHISLLGTYVHRDSLLHRAPLWVKAGGMVAVSSSVLLVNTLPATAAALILIGAAYLAGAALGLRHVAGPLRPLWPIALILGGYQWLINGPAFALLVVGNIVVCLLAARLLTLTTEGQRLLDGLVSLAKPLRCAGADPERFGLTLALMLRSVPYLIGSVQDVRDAAKARGLERNPRALVVPVFIGAVAYAHQTGEALAARGLGDPPDSPRSPRRADVTPHEG